MKSEALSQWSRSSGLSFWELAGIAVMDSILVAAGSRGSNAFRAVARLAFCFVFAMAVLYGVLGTAVMLSKGGPDFGWGELVLGELIFVPTGVLQLVSLRAVPKHV